MVNIMLINQAMSGDEDAISQIYYETYQKVYGIAVRMTGKPEDAQDILQESYLTAFSRLGELQNANRFEAWLCQIVANRCRDFIRKKKPLMFSDLSEEQREQLENLPDENEVYSPQDSLDVSEQKRWINEILDGLPEDQRLCVLMYYGADLKIREIAEALLVSENTVKSRLSYAKKKICAQAKESEKSGLVLPAAVFPFLRYVLGKTETRVPSCSPLLQQIQTVPAPGGAAANGSPLSSAGPAESGSASAGNLSPAVPEATSQSVVNAGTQNAAAATQQSSPGGFLSAAQQAVPGAAQAVGAAEPATSMVGAVGKAAAAGVKKAGKHLALKIVAIVLAVSVASTAAVAVFKPEWLYPVDFLGLMTPGPVRTLEKLEEAFGEYDTAAILECCEPQVQAYCKANGEFANIASSALLGFSADYGVLSSFLLAATGLQVHFDVLSCDISGDTATLQTNVTVTLHGSKETEECTIGMVKIGKKWYISAETLGIDPQDLSSGLFG